MSVANFHAKLANLLDLGSEATESMILARLRNTLRERDAYRDLAQKEPWGLRTTRWEVVATGDMVSSGGKAWYVVKRQVQERRRVKVWLRAEGEKSWERIYSFDDVVDVLTPSAETIVLRLLRRELGATMLSPEEAAA